MSRQAYVVDEKSGEAWGGSCEELFIGGGKVNQNCIRQINHLIVIH